MDPCLICVTSSYEDLRNSFMNCPKETRAQMSAMIANTKAQMTAGIKVASLKLVASPAYPGEWSAVNTR